MKQRRPDGAQRNPGLAHFSRRDASRFPDWKLGQILVDFGDDAVFHVGMKGVAQLRERARRSNDDDRLDPFRAHQLLQGGSDALGKALLLQLVPIRRLHAAALVLGGALEDPPGAIGTWSWVGGSSSVNTRSVVKFTKVASPALRRNSAFCPSPTNTSASCGIENLFMSVSGTGSNFAGVEDVIRRA